MSFLWPWLLVALPLPWALRELLPPADAGGALRVPFLHRLRGLEPSVAGASVARTVLVWMIWLLLVVAAARPVVLGEPVERPVSGRDLLLAVDLSASMGHRDMDRAASRGTRLDVLVRAAHDFIDRRSGDRIGLLLFGQRAYLPVAPTFDHAALKRVLDTAELGLAGRDTALGDAIGVALRGLTKSRAPARVMLLLTDGANTAGAMTPRQAARMAAQAGVRIYTVAVGTPGRAGPDTRLLGEIADLTGGSYLEAQDRAAMESVYRQIDALEPAEVATQWLRTLRPVHHWPLAAALLLSVGMALWPWRDRLRRART